MKCESCGVEEPLPFRCTYCGRFFCIDHRLPESHSCPNLWMARTPREAQRLTSKTKRTLLPEAFYRSMAWMRMPVSFSLAELSHLTVGTILVALVGLSITRFSEPSIAMAASLIIFAAAFLLHELAHKFTAQRRGLWAEFRLSLLGALITAASIILPFFKIIAPGAVIVSGVASIEAAGRISLAGPMINIVLAVAFTLIFHINLPIPYFSTVIAAGAYVNSLIAFFNLLPIGLLDGGKIISWNSKIWAALIITTFVLIYYSTTLI